jgi:FkbM family methyltransferase
MTVAALPIVTGARGPKLEQAVVKQWFADKGDATLRLDYPLSAASVVLDVGGYEGNWAAQIRERHGCRVHVFEPVPAFAANIRARFAGDPGVTVHTCGLSDQTAAADIVLSKDGTSVHKSVGEKVTIQLRRASDVIAELGLARVDLMKINIEGCEFELLTHLIDTGAVNKIENIQVQFHDFVPDAARRMEALHERLSATHRMTWHYRFVWENWRKA